MNPNKKRLRRTMMFLNAQKPGLIKDPYIYKPDSIMLDLEDAVAENQKDAARFSLYHALKTINYRRMANVLSESTDWIHLTGKKISAVQSQVDAMQSVFQRQSPHRM